MDREEAELEGLVMTARKLGIESRRNTLKPLSTTNSNRTCCIINDFKSDRAKAAFK